MRLTADVILHARASINPCDERELDLRGYKIPMIENLGVTQDQFDAMDFSDNEIKKLDNFPRYKRLSSLLLCNNHVSRIAPDLGTQLPNLACLILTNNKLATLGDLEGLRTCTKLTMLSLLHNEVVNKQYYRLYAINLVPSLKQLDFQKVTLKERESAARLAKSQAGQAMIKDVAQEAEKAKTFTPGAPASEERKLTDEHRAIYADRIAKATTVEEIEMLSKKIQAGIIPSANYKQGGGGAMSNGAAPTAVAANASKGVSSPVSAVAETKEGEAQVEARTPSTSTAAAVGESKDGDEAAQNDPPAPEAAAAESMTDSAGATAAAAAAPTPAPSSMDVEGGEGGGDDAVESEVMAVAGTENGNAQPPAAPAETPADKSKEASSGGESGDGVEAMDDGEGPGDEREGVEGGQEKEDAEQEEIVEDMGVPEENAGDEGNGEVEQEEEEEQEEEQAQEAKLSESEIKKFKVADLKKQLMQLGLSTGGLKADLQERLLEASGY